MSTTPARMRLRQAICRHKNITIIGVPSKTSHDTGNEITGECEECEMHFSSDIVWKKADYQLWGNKL